MRLFASMLFLALIGCGTEKQRPSEYGGVRILTQRDIDSIPDGATTEYLVERFGLPLSTVVGLGAYLRYSPAIDYKKDSYEKIWSMSYCVIAKENQLMGIASEDGTAVWPSNMKGKKAP